MSNDSRPGPGIGRYVDQVSMIYWWTVSNIDRQSNDLRLTDRKTVVADSAGLSQELLSDTLPQLTKKAIDISQYICRHQQKNMWFHIPTQSQTGCHSGKLYLACTSLKVISTSLRKKLMSRIDCSSSVIFNLNSPKKSLANWASYEQNSPATGYRTPLSFHAVIMLDYTLSSCLWGRIRKIIC